MASIYYTLWMLRRVSVIVEIPPMGNDHLPLLTPPQLMPAAVALVGVVVRAGEAFGLAASLSTGRETRFTSKNSIALRRAASPFSA